MDMINKEKIRNLKGKPSVERTHLKFYPKDIDTLPIPSRSLYQYFVDSNAKYEKQTILKYFGKKYTVENIMDKVEDAKKVFSKLGLKNGDSVSIAMLTTPEFVISCFALNDMGIRVDIIDFVSDIDCTKQQMKNCFNKTLILMDELYDKLEDFIDEKSFDTIITSSLYDSMIFPINKIQKNKSIKEARKNNKKLLPKNSKFIKYNDLINSTKQNENVPSAPYESAKEAFVVYSSGSSNGIPTAYVITNDSINATIFDHENAEMSFARGQTYLNVLPAIYSTTITSSLFLPLVLGVCVQLDPRFDRDLFPKQIKQTKANHFIVNASHGEALLNSDIDLTKLIYPIIGGEAIDEDVEKRFNNKLWVQHYAKLHSPKYKLVKTFLPKLIDKIPNTDLLTKGVTRLGKGYGASQFGACVTVTNEKCNVIGTVGIPLPHTKLGIFDPDTDLELGYNVPGEIRVITPSAVKRVFNDDEGIYKIFKTNPHTNEIWGHSGDIGYIDYEGRLYLKGRMDDSYIKNGKRRYPYEIEDFLKKFPFIKKCKVLRISSDNQTEKNIGYINLNENSKVSIHDMIKNIFVSYSEMDDILQLDYIRICKDFPVASSGKINTTELRKCLDMLIMFQNDSFQMIDLNSNLKSTLSKDSLKSFNPTLIEDNQKSLLKTL